MLGASTAAALAAGTNYTGKGLVQLDCAAGGEIIAWNDATLWALVLLYLFVGIYVVCDYYFVPALEVIGDYLHWSESIQGASLMAAGSSFPEFLTALFGVLFFADENPGPATNIGSAVFNVCVIVSVSVLFLPKRHPAQAPYRINTIAFARDCTFFVIAAAQSYVFFESMSPGELEWFETLCMSLTYILYIVSLFLTDRFISFEPSGQTSTTLALDGVNGENPAPIRSSVDAKEAASPQYHGEYDTVRQQDTSTSSNSEDLELSDSGLSPAKSTSPAGSVTRTSQSGSKKKSENGKLKQVKRCLHLVLSALELPYKLLFRVTIPSIRVKASPSAHGDSSDTVRCSD
mgnify:CR=1 FL=1